MKIFFKYKLQSLLILTFSLVIFVLLVVQGIILNTSMSDLVSNKIYDSSVELLDQMNIRLNEKLKEVQQISLSIVINRDINNILERAVTSDSYQQIRDNQLVSALLSNIANSRDYISEIVIVTDRMSHYNYNNRNGFVESSLVKYPLFFHHTASKNEGIIGIRENFIRKDSSDKYVFTFFRKLTSNENELGILSIFLNNNFFNTIINEHSGNNQTITFILDSEGEIISPYDFPVNYIQLAESDVFDASDFSMTNSLSEIHELDGEKYLSISSTPNSFGWTIVQFIPYSQIQNEISLILRNNIIIGLLCFLLALFFIIIFSKGITTPVKKLIQQMGLVGMGNFDVSIKNTSIKEIKELNEGFQNMTSQIKQLLAEVDKKHQEKQQVELDALQSQINPHFLYNTLDSINWMAININADDISEMVSNLGTLFRLSLNKGKDMTFVKNEILHLKCYMSIQSYRYNDKFTFIEEYDPEILGYETVKLILQPLVENCLIHGFEGETNHGEIRVEGYLTNDSILFKISDNGCGVDPEYMNESLRSSSKNTHGYGIRNVDTRIKMRFGDEYGLTYLKVEKGTSVQIKIPLIQSEEVKKNA